jgi:predicted ester cyclase
MTTLQNSIPVIIPLVLFTLFGCQKLNVSEDLSPIIHTFNEAWNTGNVTILDTVVDSLYTKHTADGPVIGLEALKKSITDHRIAFPDWHCTYVEEIYSGDKAVVRFNVTGTNTGPGVFPPTGKKITLNGIAIFRIINGKIVDDRSVDDAIPYYEQLGYTLVPPSDDKD